ncbi:MAG: GNAT family N-acetyltransferase [Burkholderiales bacterium]|nr:GNAT family N-acetyltransferase [Burkholderiales bacterium]
MDVRPLQSPDAPAYRALMLEGYTLAPDAFTSTAQERAVLPLDWWQRRLADPGGLGQAFGAFHDGVLVGSVALEYAAKPKTRHKGHVIGMYVAAPGRGRGAGRALLQAAIQHARQRPGVRLLTLTVTEGNAPALRLYEAAGFVTFGVEPMAIHTGSEYKAKVHMALLLDAPGTTAA